jgi:8-oxo-dGTP diphosphatase
MTETITESFCERCGTRYSLEPVTARRRAGIGRVRVLTRGLRNYVVNDGMPMSEAMAAARHFAQVFDRQIIATGVADSYLEQLYTYGEIGRDPRGRVVTVAYFALLPADAPLRSEGGNQARWFPVDRLPRLAFDHNEIIAYALRRLRYKLEYTAAGFELLPETFTLTELQRTYEMILGEKLDKRNFRRRILEAGIIEPTARLKSGEGRPARLYRYRADAVAEVKARRLFP